MDTDTATARTASASAPRELVTARCSSGALPARAAVVTGLRCEDALVQIDAFAVIV